MTAQTAQPSTHISPSISYCSSFVPPGLIAESFHRMARSSLRGIMEESKSGRHATHVIVEDGKLDDDMDDPDL